jgi:5-methylcytosine-specific restriction endonuclease McrA
MSILTSKTIYQRKWRLERAYKGLCVRCGLPLVNEKVKCTVCKENESQVKKQWYVKKKATMECLKCKEIKTIGMYCEKHWFMSIALANFGSTRRALEIKDLLEKQSYKCALTGRTLTPGTNASIDHIIPTSKGGTDDVTNLQWMDLDVNFAKSDLSVDAFIQLAKEITEYASRTITIN